MAPDAPLGATGTASPVEVASTVTWGPGYLPAPHGSRHGNGHPRDRTSTPPGAVGAGSGPGGWDPARGVENHHGIDTHSQ